MKGDKQILEYLKRIQAMAKTGLTYAKDPYDIERYEELADSTNKVLADFSDQSLDQILFQFGQLDNYPTPKVDVRGVVMKGEKVLLIQERSDQKWALPGGWCDIGYSAAENICKEVWEEAGYEVKVERLLSIWDKAKHDHPADLHYVYKINFLCSIVGGDLNPGHEALDADFFDLGNLPPLSLMRNTESQIRKLVDLVGSRSVGFD